MFRCLGVDLPAVVTLSSLRSSVKEFMSTAMKQREPAMCLCGRARAGEEGGGRISCHWGDLVLPIPKALLFGDRQAKGLGTSPSDEFSQ